MSSGVARLVLRRFREMAVRRLCLETLTQREQEVLKRISRGLLPEEVAAELGVSTPLRPSGSASSDAQCSRSHPPCGPTESFAG